VLAACLELDVTWSSSFKVLAQILYHVLLETELFDCNLTGKLEGLVFCSEIPYDKMSEVRA
jgi:hypothetical protein